MPDSSKRNHITGLARQAIVAELFQDVPRIMQKILPIHHGQLQDAVSGQRLGPCTRGEKEKFLSTGQAHENHGTDLL